MAQAPSPQPTQPRLAEVVAALSLATDMGTGKEPGRSLRIVLVGLHLGSQLGLREEELSTVFYVGLLAMLGCTAEGTTAASIFGDEIAFGSSFAPMVNAPRGEMMGWVLRHYAEDERFARRLSRLVTMLTAGRAFFTAATAGHCEVAQRLAGRLGVADSARDVLGAVFERWDGTGAPRKLRRAQVPIAVRIIGVAWDIDTFDTASGESAWTAVLQRRAGHTLDPAVVAAALSDPRAVSDRLHVASPWTEVLAAEPGTPHLLAGADAAASVIADFVDLKSDHLAGHSRAVAALASTAAAQLGMEPERVDTVRRAGLIHDVGRVAVTSAIWDKPGPLTDSEWETVRLHPYHAERILGRTSLLADEVTLAAGHHERCDGSGYHRGLRGPGLAAETRLLAAADAFAAMTEPRPYRPAMSSHEAAGVLAGEARLGRLDAGAVAAVVEAAGEQTAVERPPAPAGLSDREADVLRLLARGLPTKQIANRLGISAKTADHHVQSTYRKLGVATRAGATVFAMEHGLMG